jgi:F0F1-type ATP synthase delta subunit
MKGLDLSNFFTTKAQANDFSDRIAMLESNLFETDFDLESQLQKKLGLKRKDKFLSLLRENKIPMDSKKALNKFLEKIREQISKLPKAEIFLAIEPNQEILKSISGWFILNLGEQILIDITIDPSVVAGAIINYKGKRFDASVRKQFKKLIKTSENEQVAKIDSKDTPPQEPEEV